MRRTMTILVVVGIALTLARVAAATESRYERPLKAKGFTTRAIVLPARTVGETVIRAKPALAVEIDIQVENYLPRGLEPTLLIDGKPVKVASGVAGVEGQLTTLSFVIEDPGLLKDGVRLGLQMGDDQRTRSSVPGTLRRNQIRPLEQADRGSLPTLDQWLRQAAPTAK